jgi:hypothetical protein
MDQKTAEELLQQVRAAAEEKQAETGYSGLTGMLSSIGKSQPDYDNLATAVRSQANSKMQQGAMSNVIKAMLLAGGAGAGLRGLTGLQRMFSGQSKPVPSRTVDMPVAYPVSPEEEEEKTAEIGNSKATANYGLNWYIPSMVLGAPLAAYGGWKGVDAILDTQRRKKTESDLDDAKKKYQQALLGSYKMSADEQSPEDVLDAVFDEHYSKSAEEEGFIGGLINRYAPNLPGISQGLAATYAIPATVGGYALVNSIMKKKSKRALLQKAMRERARRQAQSQPAELYAIPHPKEEEQEV